MYYYYNYFENEPNSKIIHKIIIDIKIPRTVILNS